MARIEGGTARSIVTGREMTEGNRLRTEGGGFWANLISAGGIWPLIVYHVPIRN